MPVAGASGGVDRAARGVGWEGTETSLLAAPTGSKVVSPRSHLHLDVPLCKQRGLACRPRRISALEFGDRGGRSG
ncbi:hypothetical protein E2562_009280 [Oryza meyeriana var. granulata]|uniref:Uncharacterized protein n=1 Tax=Oryza meyeriana var. granulata TaxID=110450 RepID=A0A6G1E9W4_9ORYZ|nr:hypothetical protein E2562_009280 [Oryza meyeriana var. granulata]